VSSCLVHVPDPFRPVRHARQIALADLLTDEAIEHVRSSAYLLQSEWYCHGGRDFTQWNGYSLGKMVAGAALRNKLHGALSNYVACLELLRRFPETTQIDIRHDPGIVPEIWQNECSRQGMKFRLVVDQADETAPEMLRRRSLRQRLTSGLTRFLSRMQGRRSRQKGSRPLAMLVSGSLTFRHT
jgi:hypothetical protein